MISSSSRAIGAIAVLSEHSVIAVAGTGTTPVGWLPFPGELATANKDDNFDVFNIILGFGFIQLKVGLTGGGGVGFMFRIISHSLLIERASDF